MRDMDERMAAWIEDVKILTALAQGDDPFDAHEEPPEEEEWAMPAGVCFFFGRSWIATGASQD